MALSTIYCCTYVLVRPTAAVVRAGRDFSAPQCHTTTPCIVIPDTNRYHPRRLLALYPGHRSVSPPKSRSSVPRTVIANFHGQVFPLKSRRGLHRSSSARRHPAHPMPVLIFTLPTAVVGERYSLVEARSVVPKYTYDTCTAEEHA